MCISYIISHKSFTRKAERTKKNVSIFSTSDTEAQDHLKQKCEIKVFGIHNEKVLIFCCLNFLVAVSIVATVAAAVVIIIIICRLLLSHSID